MEQNQQIELPVELEESYDTSDKEQVNKARKKAARRRADRLKFVAAAMQHSEGRAWFHDLLVYCKVTDTPYRDDPYKTAFMCGMQSVGMNIMSDIQEAAPERYMDMINEAK